MKRLLCCLAASLALVQSSSLYAAITDFSLSINVYQAILSALASSGKVSAAEEIYEIKNCDKIIEVDGEAHEWLIKTAIPSEDSSSHFSRKCYTAKVVVTPPSDPGLVGPPTIKVVKIERNRKCRCD